MLRAESFRRAMILWRKPTDTSLIALALVAALLPFTAPLRADSALPESHPIALSEAWMLQSACEVKSAGAQISTTGFQPDGWHATKVPSTVLAALVADGTYPDPFFGTNLRKIPGAAYSIGKNFSEMPMPKDSPFACSWWYRTEFHSQDRFKSDHVWLQFDGINNHANIWLNGHEIARVEGVTGAYRTYEFDVTEPFVRDGTNVLAVEVFPQSARDLGINWNDWNPAPPDKDMGLWRGVSLRGTGPLQIRNPQVITRFPRGSLDEADLTIEADVHNASSKRISGQLGTVEDPSLKQSFVLAPGETRTVRLVPSLFPSLRIHQPELWWPYQMGKPVLHNFLLSVSTGGAISDFANVTFGIREIKSELDAQGHRVFFVNGRRILIRGGGWAPDMLLRESRERLQTEFRYVRDMNLNAIRLEGPTVPDAFYDLADEQGVLVLAGWTCCDYWMDWKKWTPADVAVAKASLHSEILRMRRHPSVLAWLNGSDEAPPAPVESAYIAEVKALDWPNPYLASASEKGGSFGGPSGFKMLGPYDYTPPDYWLTDTKRFGGAFGFASEISPGPAIPPLSSLRKMLPAADIEPGSAAWNFHAGGERFTNLRHFDEAMRAIYGPAAGIEDYERKAQAMAYDSERAMFEAYSRNKYGSTGVIQWMLNNAWPSLIWHLYDYYLQPAGGYFGAKKACEPLHVQYSYDDRSVVVVNSTYESVHGLKVTVELYDAGLHEQFSAQAHTDVEADAVAKVFTIPREAFVSTSAIDFAKLTLENARGEVIGSNFYWLTAKRNVYDWVNTDAYTSISSYEDLTALESLPSAGSMDVSATVEQDSEGPVVRVKLHNPGDRLAFQIRLGIRLKNDDSEILPVLWQDNYIALMPGESRELTAQFLSVNALRGGPELDITGWNVTPRTIPLSGGAH